MRPRTHCSRAHAAAAVGWRRHAHAVAKVRGRGYDTHAVMFIHNILQLSALSLVAFCSRRYTKPLTPEFQAAADKLAKQQAELDAHMRGRKLDQARARPARPAGLAMRVQSVKPSTPSNENSCGTTSTHHDLWLRIGCRGAPGSLHDNCIL